MDANRKMGFKRRFEDSGTSVAAQHELLEYPPQKLANWLANLIKHQATFLLEL